MRIHTLCLLALKAVLIAVAVAQATSETGTDFASSGTVTGHVYLADGNLLARLAHVALQRIDSTETELAGNKIRTEVHQTGMDGSFRMEHVAAGRYYVVVNRPGYPAPIEQYTAAQLANPTPEIQKQIEALPRVSVTAGGASSVDVVISHGASITGQVKYEDGEPCPEARVTLERRDVGDKWNVVWQRSALNGEITDETGKFQEEGLLVGEYRVAVELSVERRFQDHNGSSWSMSMSRVTFYLGDTTRRSAAKSIKLQEGEQATGQDIVIPVSSLHTVTGSVLDARSGQALNAGFVQLVYADDHSPATGASISPDTRSFSMEFVPEGKFLIKVLSPREGIPGTSEHDRGSPMPSLTTVRAYDNAEMPLVVSGDVSGVTLAVKEKPIP